MRLANALVTVERVSRDRPAEGVAGPEGPARRWFRAGVGESQWLATVVLITGAALVVMATKAGPRPHAGQPLLLALLACGPVLLLRRWPLPVLGLVTGATVMVLASGTASLPFSIMLGLALYFAAVGLPRRRSVPIAAATAAAIGAAMVYSALAVRTPQVAAEAVEGFVPLAGAWFIADSVTARRQYQAGLATQAERERTAEAERARQQVREERVRIAREMHDVVAHTLAVITVQAGVGRRLAARRPEEASAALESIETIGRTAQDELRVMLGLLRDGEAGAAPLAPAPRLIDIKDLVDTVQASGTPVELRMSGTERQLSPSLELSIYRVVQEALTNVVKHAPGASAAVGVAVSAGQIRLEVRDDGGPDRRPAGGEAPGAGDGTGHGIVGMRERIGAFGGWLVAEPAPDGGFRVTAEVPIEGAA
jgi:signal transduction histidine kinase